MERIVGILTVKIGSRPLGIWIVWLGLAYAAAAFAKAHYAVADLAAVGPAKVAEIVATWAILLAAIAALARRRLLARMLAGMGMVLLFLHSLSLADRPGIVLPLLVIPSLIANRRWFDEKLPQLGW